MSKTLEVGIHLTIDILDKAYCFRFEKSED